MSLCKNGRLDLEEVVAPLPSTRLQAYDVGSGKVLQDIVHHFSGACSSVPCWARCTGFLRPFARWPGTYPAPRSCALLPFSSAVGLL